MEPLGAFTNANPGRRWWPRDRFGRRSTKVPVSGRARTRNGTTRLAVLGVIIKDLLLDITLAICRATTAFAFGWMSSDNPATRVVERSGFPGGTAPRSMAPARRGSIRRWG